MVRLFVRSYAIYCYIILVNQWYFRVNRMGLKIQTNESNRSKLAQEPSVFLSIVVVKMRNLA